jgi:hypothetical protein
MHKKYAKDGLTAVSVSLDDELDKPTLARIRKFLQEKNATFRNLVLDEDSDLWQKQLGAPGQPIIFVFNRDGQWVKRFTDDFDFAEVERLAVDLLKK